MPNPSRTPAPTLVDVDDRLQELDQGEWTGRLRADIYTPEMSQQIERIGVEFAAPAGESMRDVGQRMLAWVHSVAASGPHDALAFTHGVAIRCLAGLVDEWPHERIWKTHLANAAVTVFEITDRSVVLRTFGIEPAEVGQPSP
jgi:broad specificity phosphatase PhoE